MYSEKDLVSEIKDVIESHLKQKIEVRAEWLSQSIITRHPGITGQDKDFYLVCAFGHTRSLVRNEIRKHKLTGTEDGEDQPKLPGFQYVQESYSIMRDGQPCIVPIEQMTKGEIIAKARELEKMQQTVRLHAAELWRYLAWREQQAGA